MRLSIIFCLLAILVIAASTNLKKSNSNKGSCSINEKYNAFGPNRCWDSSECKGRRYCTINFYCAGDAKC